MTQKSISVFDENEFIWAQKYRPVSIKDCILPKKNQEFFEKIVESGEIPNMLLSGIQGTGKTTTALALCQDLNLDVLFINSSEENGIDVLRSKVRQFASTVSFASEGKHKVVIFDEADAMSCLEENEEILLADGTTIPLKDLDPEKEYKVLSYSMETGEFEEDLAAVISDKNSDDVYEVEFEDGSKIILTADHPFIVKDENGNNVEMTIQDCQMEPKDMKFVFLSK